MFEISSEKVQDIDEDVSFFARIDGVESANVTDSSGKIVRLRPSSVEDKEKLKTFLSSLVDQLTEEVEEQRRFISAGSPLMTWV